MAFAAARVIGTLFPGPCLSGDGIVQRFVRPAAKQVAGALRPRVGWRMKFVACRLHPGFDLRRDEARLISVATAGS
jgi:hypothetical protein